MVSYTEADLHILPFSYDGYSKLMEVINCLPQSSFPFQWKTNIETEEFLSIIQESWHFKGVFIEDTGDVLIYRNSPSSSIHEQPEKAIEVAIVKFNTLLSHDDSYPVDSTGQCLILVNNKYYSVDGSWMVSGRLSNIPSVVLEHSYATDLIITHDKLLNILKDNNIRCGILFYTERINDNSFALIAYTLCKDEYDLIFIPKVYSYGNVVPSVNAISFIKSLNPVSTYGVGLSHNFDDCTLSNLANYELIVHHQDLLSGWNNTEINVMPIVDDCKVDLIKIRNKIMNMRNMSFF